MAFPSQRLALLESVVEQSFDAVLITDADFTFCASCLAFCWLKEISTDIRFFDDTVYELLEIAANTLPTGDENVQNFPFFHCMNIFLQFIFIDAEVAAIHINRFALYVRSAFSVNLK